MLWGRWGGDEDEALGLTNLAQLCRASAPGTYPEVIGAHFDALVAGRGDRALAGRLGHDLTAARPVLRLRLYSRDTFVDGADQFVLRDVADDLTAVLCYDLPSNVVTVTGDTLPRWGVPTDELYYQALANQRRAERGVIEDIDVGRCRAEFIERNLDDLAWLGLVFPALALKRLSGTSCPWDLNLFGGSVSYVPHWMLTCLLYTSPSPRD